jgi:hypothetical protein
MKRAITAMAAALLMLGSVACSDGTDPETAGPTTEASAKPAKDPDDVFLTTVGALNATAIERVGAEGLTEGARSACGAADEAAAAGNDDGATVMREHLVSSGVAVDPAEAAALTGAAIAAYCLQHRPGG